MVSKTKLGEGEEQTEEILTVPNIVLALLLLHVLVFGRLGRVDLSGTNAEKGGESRVVGQMQVWSRREGRGDTRHVPRIVEFNQGGKLNFEQINVKTQSKIPEYMIVTGLNTILFEEEDIFGENAGRKRSTGQMGKDARICQCKQARQEIFEKTGSSRSKPASAPTAYRLHWCCLASVTPRALLANALRDPLASTAV